MPPPLLRTFGCICVLSVLDCGSAVTTETAVGVAGQAAMLPCRSEAAGQRGVEVCWGRGQPSLFSCHNTVIYSTGRRVAYRKSPRFSVSPSSSLSISDLRPSDSGFYHCRVQLPGLFNDETSSVHLIVVHPPTGPPAAEASPVSDVTDEGFLETPRTTTSPEAGGPVTDGPDSPVTGGGATEPMVAPVLSSIQKQQQTENHLQMFVGNTVRMSFIIFVPALLLTAAFRVWRLNQQSETDSHHGPSVEEEDAYSEL